uniref:DNA-directed DNA polymerase n=1 Tax=candidate division WOR-3 bacterium TaxID=2052148 RepID=A0A7C4XVY1_UNCW3
MQIRFILFDAHSIIFRSYFAFIKNPLRNSKGENTSGIFGFLNTVERVKKKLDSERICLAFDAPGETFRDRVYKEYKATRPSPPKEIPFQIEKVKEIARYLGILIYEVEGYEADDVLATLAKNLRKYGEVYIVSSDKDLLQLVGNNIFVYDAYQDLIYDSIKVKEKFGVPPDRISDFLALAGDTIDNIPGVPGIGPHRAVEILKKYPSLNEAIENEKKLAEHKDLLKLSKELTVLDFNVPLTVNPKEMIVKNPEFDKLMPVLIDLELHSFIKELGKRERIEIKTVTDFEPDRIDFQNGVGISFSDGGIFISDGKGVYQFPYDKIKEMLHSTGFVKIGYNLKEMIKIFEIKPPLFDVQIAAWLIDPNSKSYKFEDVSIRYLSKYLMETPPIVARFSRAMYEVLKNRLKGTGGFEVYQKIEEPLIYVLAKMEKRGIKIDISHLKSLGHRVEKEMIEIAEEVYKVAGKRFNINSSHQLSKILFEDLKLTPVKRGKTHYSTDVEVLQQLSQKHQLPGLILKHRELLKVAATYIEPLIESAKNGRVHTTFNQTGTATGRLSSSNPNIQNIPIRTELGKNLRAGFIAEDGFSFISADYSQIELRILAHITKDKNLIEAFRQGRDIHNHTASLVFNIPEEMVNEHQRRMAKVVNYGLIYGMSEYGLAQGLDISKDEALQFIQTYYSLYSDVDAWRREVIKLAEDRGYTETIFGRRRPLPEIYSENYNIKEGARRAAINTPIQGTAADIIKIAMIETEKRISEAGFKSGLLLSIHDELLFEIEEERIDEAKRIIKETMEGIVNLEVPLEVKIGTGKTWAEAH